MCIGDGAVNFNFCVNYEYCCGAWFSDIVHTVNDGSHADVVGLCFIIGCCRKSWYK